MEAEEAARRWAETWARGWEGHDPDSIARLYADGARFRTSPFRDALIGPTGVREYCQWAFSDEASARCWFARPVTIGSRAVGPWWTISTDREGNHATLVGVSRLTFDAAGLVSDENDVWMQRAGALEPFDGWDR